MFDKFDFSQLGSMLESVQEQAKAFEENQKANEFTVKSGGGLVEITINGAGEVLDLNVDDSLLEDKSALQILIIAAMNDAIKMVDDNKKSGAMNMFGDLSQFTK